MTKPQNKRKEPKIIHIPKWEGTDKEAEDYVHNSPIYRDHFQFIEATLTDVDKDDTLTSDKLWPLIESHLQSCSGCPAKESDLD